MSLLVVQFFFLSDLSRFIRACSVFRVPGIFWYQWFDQSTKLFEEDPKVRSRQRMLVSASGKKKRDIYT